MLRYLAAGVTGVLLLPLAVTMPAADAVNRSRTISDPAGDFYVEDMIHQPHYSTRSIDAHRLTLSSDGRRVSVKIEIEQLLPKKTPRDYQYFTAQLYSRERLLGYFSAATRSGRPEFIYPDDRKTQGRAVYDRKRDHVVLSLPISKLSATKAVSASAVTWYFSEYRGGEYRDATDTIERTGRMNLR